MRETISELRKRVKVLEAEVKRLTTLADERAIEAGKSWRTARLWHAVSRKKIEEVLDLENAVAAYRALDAANVRERR